MTTYTSSFVLEGEEVLIYRAMLESWAAIATGRALDTVDRLIHNTYEVTGESAAKVEEHIRVEIILPFYDVMAAELDRMNALVDTNRKLPLDKRDYDLSLRLTALERVVDKVHNTHISSAYRPLLNRK